MGLGGTRLISTALLYGIGVLSLILVLELVWFAVGSRDATMSKSALSGMGQTQALSIRDIGVEQDFQEVIDRPLFNWNRKPVPLDAAAPQVQTSDIESRWELSGIVAAGKANFAYFKPLDGGQPTRLEEGMYFEKWKVLAIGQEQVVLTTGDSAGQSASDEQADDAEQKVFRLREMAAPEKPKKGRSTLAKRKRAAQKKAEQTEQRTPKKSPPDVAKPAS